MADWQEPDGQTQETNNLGPEIDHDWDQDVPAPSLPEEGVGQMSPMRAPGRGNVIERWLSPESVISASLVFLFNVALCTFLAHSIFHLEWKWAGIAGFGLSILWLVGLVRAMSRSPQCSNDKNRLLDSLLVAFASLVFLLSLVLCTILAHYFFDLEWKWAGIVGFALSILWLVALVKGVLRSPIERSDEEADDKALKGRLSGPKRTKYVIESIMYTPPHSFPPDVSRHKHYDSCPECGSRDFEEDWSEQAPWEIWYHCKKCGRYFGPD